MINGTINGWQKAFYIILGLTMVVYMSINGWALIKVIAIGQDVAAIKANRFTDEDGRRLQEEISVRVTREELYGWFKAYLDEKFATLGDRIDRLEED